MMYVPFARKYRPRRFSEVVGQEVPKRILLNSVRTGRLAHAYIFAGPRGTGKTTLARILTKAINCLRPLDGEPCLECENCISIEKGSFPDLIEIDAASNRGIDDIRAIRDAVSYTPIKGKYKVYILDEAHMLTKEAFNALLKTLEEPPPRTLFILCTTEYEKILPTILSRCQRLLFGKLSTNEIITHLKNICEKEGITYEESALKDIAMVSDGAMRDAVSLLEQASVYGDGKVSQEIVEEFLGIPSTEKIRDFIRLLVRSDVDFALSMLDDMLQRGFNLLRFWDLLEEEIRNLIIYKSLKDPYKVMEVEDFHREFDHVPINALLYLEKVINTARADARTRSFQRACELAIIKTLIVKDIVSISELPNYLTAKTAEEVSEKQVKEESKNLAEEFFEKAQDVLKKTEYNLLKSLSYTVEGNKLVFTVKSDDLKVLDVERIKKHFPFVEFSVVSTEEEKGLPEFAQKVKDLFGGKVIKHESKG